MQKITLLLVIQGGIDSADFGFDERNEVGSKHVPADFRPPILAPLTVEPVAENRPGLKPIGLMVTAIALLAIAIRIALPLSQGQDIPVLAVPGGGITILLLLVWSFWIHSDWIRIPADGYAQRLLASLESIEFEEKKN